MRLGYIKVTGSLSLLSCKYWNSISISISKVRNNNNLFLKKPPCLSHPP